MDSIAAVRAINVKLLSSMVAKSPVEACAPVAWTGFPKASRLQFDDCCRDGNSVLQKVRLPGARIFSTIGGASEFVHMSEADGAMPPPRGCISTHWRMTC